MNFCLIVRLKLTVNLCSYLYSSNLHSKLFFKKNDKGRDNYTITVYHMYFLFYIFSYCNINFFSMVYYIRLMLMIFKVHKIIAYYVFCRVWGVAITSVGIQTETIDHGVM